MKVKNKIKFIIMYGQTEAPSRMTSLQYENLKSKIDSIGVPIPGGKIFLRNKKNEHVVFIDDKKNVVSPLIQVVIIIHIVINY